MGAAFFGGSPHVRQFIHMFFEVFPNFLCYLPVALPTMLSFKRKILGIPVVPLPFFLGGSGFPSKGNQPQKRSPLSSGFWSTIL